MSCRRSGALLSQRASMQFFGDLTDNGLYCGVGFAVVVVVVLIRRTGIGKEGVEEGIKECQ